MIATMKSTFLLACRTNQPEKLRVVLSVCRPFLPGGTGGDSASTPIPAGDAPASLPPVPQAPPQRYGNAFFVGGEPLVQRLLAESNARALSGIRSTVFFGQGYGKEGQGGDGPTPGALCGPFRQGRLVLALDGGLGLSDSTKTELAEQLPDNLRISLRSRPIEEAELVLAMFWARLQYADPEYLTTPDLPPTAVVSALGQVLESCLQSGIAAGDDPAALTVSVSDGRFLVVARRGLQPVYYGEVGAAEAPEPVEVAGAAGAAGAAKSDDQRQPAQPPRGFVALTTDEATQPEWCSRVQSFGLKELPQGSALILEEEAPAARPGPTPTAPTEFRVELLALLPTEAAAASHAG